jgi:hypothetical protein
MTNIKDVADERIHSRARSAAHILHTVRFDQTQQRGSIPTRISA